jgi:hypothetical protein
MERTMYRDGRTPFTSVFTVELRGHLGECQLRIALQRVQAKHPLLRCVVDDSSGRPCFAVRDDPAPLALRVVDRSNENQWEEEVRREWITPFNGAVAGLVRLTWLRGFDVHNLVVSAHHCICDGQAGIGLLRDLLRACNDPECEIGSYEEIGSLEDIVPPAMLQDHRFYRRLRWKRRSLEFLLWWKTRRAAKSAPTGPKDIYFHRFVLSREITQSITERAKAEAVTLLAPMALAFMQAFRDVRGTKAIRNVSAMVNARRFLHHMRPDGLFGLAPGVRMLVTDLPAPSDSGSKTFWKRARAMKVDLDKRVEQLGKLFYPYLLSLEGLHHKYNSVVEFFERAPAVRDLTFSNMGRLALGAQDGNLRVGKVFSPLVMVSPTPANTVVLSSFAGEMEFAIISDEQSLPRADAAAISHRASEILKICAVG